jgi:hypothetical protein
MIARRGLKAKDEEHRLEGYNAGKIMVRVKFEISPASVFLRSWAFVKYFGCAENREYKTTAEQQDETGWGSE